jgi:transposase-like protein
MSRAMTEKWLAELRGSRPWTEAEGQRVIEAWEASGESVASFARRTGLVPQRVYWWRGRLGAGAAKARVQQERVASVPAFLPVTVRAASAPTLRAGVTVCTREGLRVEVAELDATSALWVATLVRSIEEMGT